MRTHGKHKLHKEKYMRTKVLLCAAALAASLASSMAQNVYSLNVVGYYNVTIPANGFFMVANQLNTTNNSLGSVIPAPADGSQIYIYSGGYSAAAYDGLAGAWDNPNIDMSPGKAGFFRDNSGAGQVLTFVGEVLQNTSPGLINTLPAGVFSVRASMVPQQGKLTADLAVPGDDGDQVYVYNGGYATDAYDGLAGDWGVPGGLTIKVGQGFFYHKVAGALSTLWVRSFTVQ